MRDDDDDKLKCPYCGRRVKRPKPAVQTTIHRRVCKKCKKRFVVQDDVEHRFQTAPPPPMQIGDKFRISPKLFGKDKHVYTAKSVHLTVCQGWWVYGEWKKGHCSIDCASAVPVKE